MFSGPAPQLDGQFQIRERWTIRQQLLELDELAAERPLASNEELAEEVGVTVEVV